MRSNSVSVQHSLRLSVCDSLDNRELATNSSRRKAAYCARKSGKRKVQYKLSNDIMQIDMKAKLADDVSTWTIIDTRSEFLQLATTRVASNLGGDPAVPHRTANVVHVGQLRHIIRTDVPRNTPMSRRLPRPEPLCQSPVVLPRRQFAPPSGMGATRRTAG